VNILKMAWRNVWRNRRRSLVTIAAMSLGLFTAVQYSGLVRGYIASAERNVLDMELGDLQIVAPGYREDPSIYNRIDDADALLKRLDAAGFQASARLLSPALMAGQESSAGVELRGIDVGRDARTSTVSRHLYRGRWLEPGEPRGVVIGRRLARMLDVSPGDEVVVLTQAADGSLANDLYSVRGVLRSVGEATDRAGVFMSASAFRRLLVLPRGAHQVIVRRPDRLPLEQAAGQVRRLAPGQQVRTWRELMPTLASMLDASETAMTAMFMLVYIAIGIVILNAMLMAVFERIRELGVLKALGMGPLSVFTLVALESAMQTALAVLAGLAVAVPVAFYLARAGLNLSGFSGISVAGIAFDPVWRAKLAPATFLRPVLLLVCVAAAAGLYPALKAAMIRPVRAITHL
jgi:putative ABC transport system permease protein